MDANTEVTLGGRVFVATPSEDMTFDQFAWVQAAAIKAGLGEELVRLIKPVLQTALDTEKALEEGAAEALTEAIVMRAYQNRAHLDVLTGMLVEKGKKWNYEDATKNKDFIGGLRGQEDISKANVALAEQIMAFFLSGLDSIATSQKSGALGMVLERLVEGESGQDTDSVSSES